MTLIVWVGNKDALAFAADSVGSVGHKTFIVNKLFEISDNDPVWVAIAWSPDFMGILLETIIKEFRKSIVNHREETLFDYVNLFLEYINGAEYVKNISDKELIETLISSLIQVLKDSLDNIVSEALNDPEFEKKSVQEQSSLLLNRSEKNVTQVLVRILSKLQRQKINLSGVEEGLRILESLCRLSFYHFKEIFC